MLWLPPGPLGLTPGNHQHSQCVWLKCSTLLLSLLQPVSDLHSVECTLCRQCCSAELAFVMYTVVQIAQTSCKLRNVPASWKHHQLQRHVLL